MIVPIAHILAPDDLSALRATMGRAELFADGAATAGWRARGRKHNLQAIDSGPVAEALRRIAAALERNPVFNSAARPKRIVKLLLSRYEPGMAYGTHVDDALMAGLRTDLSFTLFVSEPGDCDGGELVIEEPDGERAFKLPAGQLVLYPSTTLHRVEPVTRGVRLVAVGWVRSLVREDAQRTILFDLDQVIAGLRGRISSERALDLALKARSNLLRRWIDD
jgi:PKHD-type hydroxylase